MKLFQGALSNFFNGIHSLTDIPEIGFFLMTLVL